MTPEYNVEKKSKAEQKQGKLKKGASDHANLSLSPFWSGVTYFKLMAGPLCLNGRVNAVLIGQSEAEETLKGKTHFYSRRPACTVHWHVMNTNTVHVSLHNALLWTIKVSLCHRNGVSTKMVTVTMLEVMRF